MRMRGLDRRRQVLLVVASVAAVVLGALGGYGLSSAGQAPPGNTWDSPQASAPVPDASGPGGSGTPSTSPPPPAVPAAGSGQFAVAGGSGGRIGGGGRLVRFRVVVELVDGATPVAPATFAAAVERTLADARSWIAAGQWSFQRVSDGPADVVVHLTTPATTDQLCGRYGLDTGGEVSCRGGPDIMINLRRWLLAVPWYDGAIDDYRNMLVNHEIGHFLGHGHAACPGPGRPAPVMQTQTYGLEGCVRNPWPYPDGHTYVG